MTTPPLLTPDERRIVDAILARLVPTVSVCVFGSRATGQHARRYSDLDLALMTREPLPPDQLAELAEAFEESDLPWTVDVIDWAAAGAVFRQRVAADLRPWSSL